MIKTKLQIKREEKGLTVGELAHTIVYVLATSKNTPAPRVYISDSAFSTWYRWIYQLEEGTHSNNWGAAQKLEDIAKALNCAVEDLTED
ncbi:hypothetical protein ACFO26_06985 [Lactococcus nasutitermitis]|uniref:HTH cro/C1-type domain-containing protein n=1 Tax=Lactococcus nasutitermitis TaxID=1652957 RepID=A0ABV9JEC6_9LACT|nr:hypothetical protein [Lactococcus nasutitermitis]